MKNRGYSGLVFIALLLCTLFVTEGEAADRIRLGVVGFASKAEGVSDEQAGIITDLLTRTLASSQSIALMEREQISRIGEELHFDMSGLVDPEMAAEIGRIKGLQYMVLGSVTELAESASATIVPIIGSAKHEARATIDARIVDVETSEVLYTFVMTGGAVESTTVITIGNFTNVEASFGGLKARAIADAVNRLAHEIRADVGHEYSNVTSVNGSEVKINVGSSLGVQPGVLYLVYVEGEPEIDLNGRILGRNKIPIAAVKVKTTQNGFSTCTVAEGTKGSLIQRGDRIEPITANRAKEMVVGKEFPLKERPPKRAYDDTFIEAFGADGQDGGAAPDSPEPGIGGTAEDGASPEPRSAPQRQGSYKMRQVEGVDPNSTTDAKLIEAYDFLSPVDRNNLGVAHRGAWSLYSGKKYKDAFEALSKLALDYPGNYLSAYWAGMAALKLKSDKEAAEWFESALSINPNYQPAIDERAKLGDNPENAPEKKKRK
jgi:curli biogenesis system outer membrane secretion channel CsgG/TolA-binding protein